MIWCISGYNVIIDDADYSKFKIYNYHINSTDAKRGHYYFQRHLYIAGVRTIALLHRDIMECITGDGKIVDHKSGDTLDCRKSNMRVCSQIDNAKNRKINKNNSSGVKGVTWDNSSQKWLVRIGYMGKRVYLGVYADIKEAEEIYTKAAIEFHGEFLRQK